MAECRGGKRKSFDQATEIFERFNARAVILVDRINVRDVDGGHLDLGRSR